MLRVFLLRHDAGARKRLSTREFLPINVAECRWVYGSPGWNRTNDQTINSRLLYR